MYVNPVLQREMRARWRGWRAYGLLFGYVVFLSVVIAWCYQNNMHYEDFDDPSFNPYRRMAALGHELFMILSGLQSLFWALIPAILTSTTISSEREQGMLEGLQLSRLATSQIVLGKLCSSLALCVLLILVTLPLEAVCFLMGGVSPGEFFAVLTMHSFAALAGASFGLASSAWNRRSPVSVGFTIAFAVFWFVGTFIFAIVSESGPSPAATVINWQPVYEFFGKLNPIFSMFILLNNHRSGPLANSIDWLPAWQLCTLANASATPVLLWLAVRGTKRIHLPRGPLVDWAELRRELRRQGGKSSSSSTRPEKPPAHRLEIGFLARWQTKNPVLGREVRACFRPRSSSAITATLLAVLSPFALIAYGYLIYKILTTNDWGYTMGSGVLWMYLAGSALLAAVLGAGAFAREREGNTLTALRLSMLSPLEILLGKIGAPLAVSALFAVIFLPILLSCVDALVLPDHSAYIMTLSRVAAGLIIVASTTWCLLMYGLTISWFSRRTVTAVCWTLGTMMAFYAAAPALLALIDSYGVARIYEDFLRGWHPFFAMYANFDTYHYRYYDDDAPKPSTVINALSYSLPNLVVGTLLFAFLLREISRAHRKFFTRG